MVHPLPPVGKIYDPVEITLVLSREEACPGCLFSGAMDEPSPSQSVSPSTGSVVRRVAPTPSSVNGGTSQVLNEASSSPENAGATSQSDGFDLENLPPPPPPPNILPPSPPPNILPTVEE